MASAERSGAKLEASERVQADDIKPKLKSGSLSPARLHTSTFANMVKPITGVCDMRSIWLISAADIAQMLRRGLVLDLSVAFGKPSNTPPKDSTDANGSGRRSEDASSVVGMLTEILQVSEQPLDTAGGMVRRMTQSHASEQISIRCSPVPGATRIRPAAKHKLTPLKASTSHPSAAAICSTRSWRTSAQKANKSHEYHDNKRAMRRSSGGEHDR
jgi:hypothetical protein